MSEVTLLSEDILQIAGAAGEKKLELNRLCRDYRNPLLLHDKKPVLNMTQDDLVGIFVNDTGHYCISPEQVLRLGVYCKLNLPRLISLMVKAEWECLILTIAHYSDNPKQKSLSVLRDKSVIEKYIPDFKPDTGKFFTLIKNNLQNLEEKLSYGLVDLLINDLLDGSKFLSDNVTTGKLFPDKKNSEILLLAEASASQRAEYKELKLRWAEKSSELDDYLFHLEQKKRASSNSADRYYQTFGKQESVKSALVYRIEKLSIVLKIMKEHPGSNYRMLLLMAEEYLRKADIKKKEIRHRIARSQNFIDFGSFGIKESYQTEDLRNKYIKEVKKLLRKIWFLCHPDTSPNYRNLCDVKRKEVDDLWLRIMSSAREEQYSYSPHMLLYHVPDIALLEEAYMKLCSLLNVEPDLYETGNRLDFMIRTGAAISALIEFLKDDISKISLQLTSLELIRDEYTDESNALKFRAALENISKHSERLDKEIGDLKKRLGELKHDIINEFKKAN